MKKVLKYIGYFIGFLATLAIILIVWGFIGGRLTDMEQYRVELPRLPEAWERETIAQISDIQVGIIGDNEEVVDEFVEQIIEAKPAAVLITGDFIYKPEEDLAKNLKTLQNLLRPLDRSSIPVFAVLGNHDYGMSGDKDEPNIALAKAVTQALQKMGIEVLKNESATVYASGSPLEIVGIGPHWVERDHVSVALATVPDSAARIIFMHNPDSFEEIPPGDGPLALAGHTHGGQIQIPFTPRSSWLIFIKSDEVHAAGWIIDYGNPGNHLYVNRGIGFSIVPLRINARPELTFFKLTGND